jgi:cobalt-zinc-cadmium resistance protein CzcA
VPFDEWPRGLTKEKLTEQMPKELSDAFPGVVFNFSQSISDNVEEAIGGVKGENSVKVFGQDLERNEALADGTSERHPVMRKRRRVHRAPSAYGRHPGTRDREA